MKILLFDDHRIFGESLSKLLEDWDEISICRYIDIFKMAFQVINIRLHQLGLTGSTNARDDLDVRSTIQFNDSVEILCSCNCFHIVTYFQKSKIFHFLKLLRCTYYTVC